MMALYRDTRLPAPSEEQVENMEIALRKIVDGLENSNSHAIRTAQIMTGLFSRRSEVKDVLALQIEDALVRRVNPEKTTKEVAEAIAMDLLTPA